jgi:hypothetical protein
MAGGAFGVVGLAICLCSSVVLWIVNARVVRVAQRASVELEETLVTIGQRVHKSRNRFRTAKSTTQDVKSSLGQWAERDAAQRVSSRVQAAEKAAQVADSLQRADNLLEVAASLSKLVDHAFSLGAATDAPRDATSTGGLHGDIAAVRRRLDDAADDVARIRARIDALSDEESSAERIEQAAQIAVRLVASLDWMDFRLEKTAENLRATQTRLHEYTSRAQRWMSLATLGLSCVALLMALGQLALCRLAWIGGRSGV